MCRWLALLLMGMLCFGCARQESGAPSATAPTQSTTKQPDESANDVSDDGVDTTSPTSADSNTARSDPAYGTSSDRSTDNSPSEATDGNTLPTNEPSTAATPESMTAEQIEELVRTVVAQQLDELNRQQANSGSAEAQRIAREAKQAAIAAQQAAEQSARQRADEARQSKRQDEEALARFLLLPDELKRVDRIREKLKSESIWGLTRQDLSFASTGFAAPLLHDALHKAADRFDPNIEMDVLSREANLSPDEKIQLATLQPIERERLLQFAGQFDEGTPSPEADRFIREYVNRYPVIGKIVLEHVKKAKVSQ